MTIPKEVVDAMGGRSPTAQQWQAISHPLGPRAVIAGAGSGKTAVVAARVVWLVMERLAGRDGAMPSEILCLTFTNKAAEELGRRVRKATAALGLQEAEDATVLTYHAFGQSLIQEFGARLGLEPGGMLLSQAHRWQIAATLLADREFEHYEVRTLGTIINHCLTLNDQCADHGVTPDEVVAASRKQIAEATGVRGLAEVVDAALKRCELAELVGDYQAHKRAIGAFDFGDLIAVANDLVRTHPDVVDEFRGRYRAVLLDEYQDTNIAQARLLEALCGRDASVFAVGDPDQNIYAWRGASLRNLLRFSGDFGSGEDSLPLYVNFRSGERILAVADRVIADVPEERRAAGKHLEPDPERGTGRVLAFVESDERAEAARIASIIREMLPRHQDEDGDPRWTDFAILCRKKRLFPPIADVLRESGIPVEVVDLGGLLRMPEVVDVVAWLRLLEDPSRNIALARVLQGPAWRIGYRDLVALARWSARHNRRLTEALPDTDEVPEDVSFALLEALDHLDDEDMINLSREARDRLREFRSLFAGLRESSLRTPSDLVAAIVDGTGLAREIEAAGTPAAGGALRNLANFAEFVTTFSPVHGEATLSTLMAYLDAAEDAEDEMSPAQPSDANTVKIMTVHKAKGLEWPVVFVPGLAEHTRWGNSSIFPDAGRQADPLRQPQTLPFELRGDRDVLPVFSGKLAHFKQELKARAMEEERRLCYVALTRARDVAVVSAAHWYGDTQEPHQPGTFYREIAEAEGVEKVFESARPEVSPLIEARAARAPVWPPPARIPDGDELFPGGWHDAAVASIEDPAWIEERVAALEPGQQSLFRRVLEENLARAELVERRTRTDGRPAVPDQFGATAIADYIRCPKLFYWSVVRPLPRRPSPAARLGTDVHRWIELQSRGQATLIDPDELPDLSGEGRSGFPTEASRLREAWRASRFANAVPLHVERKFLLVVDGFVVGGRIDAVFGEPGGPWEIVDYKTGRKPAEDDPVAGVQLDVYALAAHEIWGIPAEKLTLTYAYLNSGAEVSRPAGDLSQVRARLREALAGIEARRFDPAPGPHCNWCDFLAFCAPGRTFVGDQSEGLS